MTSPEINEFLSKAQKFVELGSEIHELGKSLVADIDNMVEAMAEGYVPDCPTPILIAAITGVLRMTEQLKDMGIREKQENN